MKSKINIYEIIATVFGIGYCPVAPGTAGSLAGLLLCVFLHKYLILYLLFFAAFFIVGVASADKVSEKSGDKDPSFIVIDEFASIFIVFLFVPIKPLVILIGFALYRLFDIIKPPPLRLLEKPGGGWGIMLDDLGAGIYANLILQALFLLNIL